MAKSMYVGIEGVSRLAKAGYIGVGGVARCFTPEAVDIKNGSLSSSTSNVKTITISSAIGKENIMGFVTGSDACYLFRCIGSLQRCGYYSLNKSATWDSTTGLLTLADNFLTTSRTLFYVAW